MKKLKFVCAFCLLIVGLLGVGSTVSSTGNLAYEEGGGPMSNSPTHLAYEEGPGPMGATIEVFV